MPPSPRYHTAPVRTVQDVSNYPGSSKELLLNCSKSSEMQWNFNFDKSSENTQRTNNDHTDIMPPFSQTHHVSLLRNNFTLQSLFHSFADREDPYYEIDGQGSLKGINSPRFNISETETAYLLNGEFAGLANKNQIVVEWLQNQLLIIRGSIGPGDTETMTDPFKNGLKNEIPTALGIFPTPTEVTPMLTIGLVHTETHESVERAELDRELDEPVFTGPKAMLRERHIGQFQRSFTFPTDVDSDHMEASLADGLLRIVVPKKAGAVVEKKRIEVK